MEQKRGQLTDIIKKKSKELLSYGMNQTELRLMPYIQYIMTNTQKIDIAKINKKERAILSKWRKAKHIESGTSRLQITKEFWDIICEIIMLGYVDIENEN